MDIVFLFSRLVVQRGHGAGHDGKRGGNLYLIKESCDESDRNSESILVFTINCKVWHSIGPLKVPNRYV